MPDNAFDELKAKHDAASEIAKEAQKAFIRQIRYVSEVVARERPPGKNRALRAYADNPCDDTHGVYIGALDEYKAAEAKLEELRAARHAADLVVAEIDKTYGPILAIRHNISLLAKEGFSLSYVISILE